MRSELNWRVGKQICFLRAFILGACCLVASAVYGQTTEICNNNIDDDGDGLVDCADSDCNFAVTIEKGCRCFDAIDNDSDGKVDSADPNCAAYYGLSFVGSGSGNCSITPPAGNPFSTIAAPQTSSQNTADTPAHISVGDMNNDGMPDVVITSKWNSTVQVVATTTIGPYDAGDIMADFRTPGSNIFPFAGSKYVFEHETAIADINKDKIGELYVIASERGGSPNNKPVRFYLCGFRYANNSLVPLFNAVFLSVDRPGNIGIADFDGDGKAEVYIRNRIYAAESGVLLADGGGSWDQTVNAGSVAANIVGDSKLELICGPFIYSAPPTLAARTYSSLAGFIAKNMNTLGVTYYPKGYIDPLEYGVDQASTTSVGDMNGDGFLDVWMTGAINCSGNEAAPCGNPITTVFYWDVKNNTVKTYQPPDGVTPATGWAWGTGRINLGDADGNGKLNALFVAGNKIFCLALDGAGNIVVTWIKTINDSLSGIIALTIYDFDNDGHPEIVYRDEKELATLDGLTGQTKLWSATCGSHTFTEGPVIADVNGDGNTDICVPCYTNGAIGSYTVQQQSLGQTRLYYSSTNAWLPTRRVWNQHGYYVTNINDNLTLPFPQVDPSLVFSNAPCPNGLPGPQRPLNIFMNQIPNLSANGCPVFPAPDLTFKGDDPANPGVDVDGDGVYSPAVTVIPPICGDLPLKAFFTIINSGDLPISDVVPVSFFNGDPTLNPVTAVRLLQSTININNLGIGQTLVTPQVTIPGPGTAFDLYIVLYNNGAVLPINLSLPSGNECTISNNMYKVRVTPDPFTVTVSEVAPNVKCGPNVPPFSGEIRARIFKGGVEQVDYSPYSFQWYTGAGTGSPIAGGTTYHLTNVQDGTYTVVVTNTAKGCASLPIQGVVTLSQINPAITLTVTSNQTTCTPPNGRIDAAIAGGNTGYTFDWYDIALTPLGITGPTATNLVKGNYVVVVTKNGCSTTSAPASVQGPTIPDAQASLVSGVVDCLNPNSGSVTATALIGINPQPPAGYTFNWYFYNFATSTRGSILPAGNGTGPTRTGLAAGYYQVEIKDNATQCLANQSPFIQVTDQTVVPTVAITEVAPQTSCNPATPNGILTAVATAPGLVSPTDYTFQWFRGDNTLPANLHASVTGAKGETATQIPGGGVFYTVKVTTANNCSATNKLIITETLNVPIVTLTTTPNGICNPALAASTYSGTITATATFGGAPVVSFTNYQFVWHNGPLVTDPVIAVANDKNPVLSQLNGGNYSVTLERTDLGCKSVLVPATVANATVLPVLTMAQTGSTNCTPALANGTASVVTVDGVPSGGAGYTYAWTGPVAPAFPVNIPTNNSNTPTLIKLQGGPGYDYTVLVTNTATGCQKTTAVNVADAKVLPIVSLAVLDNGICNPALTVPAKTFSGKLTASITNQVGLLTDYTFVFGAGMGPGVQTANVFDQLNGGATAYSAVATHTLTGCVSAQVTAPVANVQAFPVLTTSTTASTNCAVGKENGIAQVLTVDGTAVGVATGYTYAWTGPVAPPFPVNVATNQSNTATLIKVQGGVGYDYTVVVTNQGNGCQTSTPKNVTDAKVLPIVSLAPQDNGICNPALTVPPKTFSGKITASITNQVGLLTDYTFVFGAGMGPGVQAANVYDQLNGGATAYTAVATHTPTGCVSTQVSTPIANVQVFPVLTTSTTPSTNCAAGLENGVAEVLTVDGTAVGVATGYTYSWTGTLFAVNIPTNQSNTARLIKLQGGVGSDYNGVVTNQGNGCQTTVQLNVVDARVLPLLSLTPTQNTICDPSKAIGGVFDGKVDAVVTNMPGGAVVTDYFFNWSVGVDGNGVVSSTGLDAGTYSVTAKHNPTGCTSAVYSDQVLDGTVLPVISMGQLPSTNCAGGTPNGTAQVTNVVPNGKTYDYRWFNGNSTAAPAGPVTLATLATTNNYTGVQGGMVGPVPLEYTAEVLIKQTGCASNNTIAVADDSQVPVLGLPTGVDNTFCVGANGSAALSTLTYRGVPQANPYPGFTFLWSNGNTTPNTTTALAAGNYTLTAKNTADNCTSNPVPVTINDNLWQPVINFAEVPQGSCDPLAPNGQLQATVNENAPGGPGGGAAVVLNYTFAFTNRGNPYGPVVLPAPNPMGANGINQLAGNIFYEVTVTSTITGCANVASHLQGELINLPQISLSGVAPQTSCVPPDGSVTGTVTSPVTPPTTTYTFYWLREDTGQTTNDENIVKSTVIANQGPGFFNKINTVAVLTNILGGTVHGRYTLVVEDDFNKCLSQAVSADIANNTVSNVTITIGTLPTSCATDGALTMKAVRVSPPPSGQFDFEVYRGGPTNPITPIDYYSNPPNPPTFAAGAIQTLNNVNNNTNVTTTAAGIISDLYTVVAVDDFGCRNHQTFFLPFQDAHTVNSIATNVTNCTVDNGSLAVRTGFPPVGLAPAYKQGSYQITFFSGGVPLAANEVDITVPGSTFTGIVNASGVPAATGNPHTPFVSAEVCNNAADDDGDGKTDMADEDCSGRTTAALLPIGFYLVESKELISGAGCKVYEQFEIKQDARPAVVDIVGALQANTSCNVLSADGSATVSITKDPLDLVAGVTYSLNVNPAPLVGAYPIGPIGVGNQTINGLKPDTSVPLYTVTVTSNNNCVTTQTLSIPDQPIVAQLVNGSIAVTDAAYCLANLEQTAKVVVSNVKLPGGANEDIRDYQFQWFTDAALTTNVFTALGNPAATAGGDEFINQTPLPANGTVPSGTVFVGDYYVRAVKMTDVFSLSGGVGCTTAPFTVTIADNSVTPNIVLTPNGNTSCDPAFFEGSINVNVSTPSGPGPAGPYDYVWVPNGVPLSGSPTNSAGNNGVNNLQPNIGDGTYTLTATNTTSGCPASLPTTLTHDTPPVFTLTASVAPLQYCNTFDGNIAVTTVLADLAPAPIADFDFVWYKTDPNTVPVLDGTGPPPVDTQLTSATFPAITTGTYYVKTVRKAGTGAGAGCESAPHREDILDNRIFPTATATTIANTACDNNFDGKITVTGATVSGPGSLVNSYDFVWTAKPGAPVVINNALAATSPHPTGVGDVVGPGTYTVQVSNATTGCPAPALDVDLLQNTVPLSITSVTGTPVDRCLPLLPNGTGTVNTVSVDGGAGLTTDFTYTWDDDPLMGSPLPMNTVSVNGLDIDTWYVKAVRNAFPVVGGSRSASGCETAVVSFAVNDARLVPTLSIATIDNTSCDNSFDGQITITASTAVGGPFNYDYIWTANPGVPTVVTNALNKLGPHTTGGADVIGPGNYTINVINFTSKCATSAPITLLQNTVPLSITSVTATPVDVCLPLLPNGTGTVNTISVDGGAGLTTDFTYTWDDDPLMASPLPANTVAVNGLDIDTWYVKAVRNNFPVVGGSRSASGCETAIVPFLVDDARVVPTVSFTTLANTACDNNFDGQITINASTAGGGPFNYDFVWTANPGAPVVVNNALNAPSPHITGGADVIGPGNYTISVTNFTSKCATSAPITLLTNPQVIDVVTVAKTDQLICYPDGSITVTALTSGVPGNFTYEWYQNSPASPQLVDNFANPITVATLVPGIAPTQFPTMGAGTYFVKALKGSGITPGSGCSTPPFRIDVQDLHQDPKILFTYSPNSSCDAVNPNGVVLADASEQSGANGDTYSFAWTLNAGAIPPATTQTDTNNSSQLDNAFEGTYILTIMNVSNTGCQFTSSLDVQKDLNISLPNIVNTSQVDPLDCLNSGSAQVTGISVGGGPVISGGALVAGFTFEWYDGTFPGGLNGVITPAYNGIGPGFYFVVAKDNSTQCKSGPTEVEIVDDNIVYPVVNISQPAQQISCIAGAGTASLAGTADGFTDANVNYTFDWTNNLTNTPPIFATTSTITNLETGDYSLFVRNVATNCTASQIFVVPDDSPFYLPVISIGGNPRTFCVGLDGSFLARVTNLEPTYPFPFNFTSDLYIGATPNLSNPPDFPNMPLVPGFIANFLQQGLDLGAYTVRVTDNNTGCFAVLSGNVLDARANPVVAIVEENPLTNCDPLRANGQLAASADGGFVGGYTFEWVAGLTVPTPISGVIVTDNLLIGKPAGNYAVRVTNDISGCSADKSGAVTDATVTPPVPTPTVVADRENCLVPDGWVTVTVGGETVNYTFDWYDGSTVSGGPDFSGIDYIDIDIGPYAVTATDLVTGCVSPPGIVEVLDKRTLPTFSLTSTASVCSDTGQPANGSLQLESLNAEVNIDKIVWIDLSNNGNAGEGVQVFGVYPGLYRATVTSMEGCVNTGDVQVRTEIGAFNGVSDNGSDGLNDTFIIDCISNFPNNNVKIFNRSGILVYEANHYDNLDVAFRGTGENGLYMQGKRLPEGTYFYIIDKGDGSKIKSGYLELTR